MGDFNAKIGADISHSSCGKFVLGETNERGEMLLDWLDDNKLVSVNTMFQRRIGQRHTWVSPGGKYRNMIDYIAVRRRNFNEVANLRSVNSADCGSDHQLVWVNINQGRK